MPKRIWGGFYLTPWLLASTGCSTIPFGHSVSTPLPPERRLAIAQAFEKQGHKAQAQAIYEQIASSGDPVSAVAAQRLESLVAKQARKAIDRSGQRRQSTTPETSIARRDPLPDADSVAKNAVTGDSSAESLQAVAETSVVKSTSDILQDTELHAAAHKVADSSIAARRTPPLPVSVEIPYSRSAAESNEDIDWQRPTKIVHVTDGTTLVEESPEIAETLGLKSGGAATTGGGDLTSQSPETPESTELPSQAASNSAALSPLHSGQDANTPLSNGQSKDSTRSGMDGIPSEMRFLFGRFKPEIIGDLSKDRARFQDALLAVAMDPDVDQVHRSRAIFLIGQLGSDAAFAVSGLKVIMNSAPTNALRIETAETILSIQPTNEEAVRSLLQMLKDEDLNSRWYAAFALRMASSAHPDYANFTINRLLESIDTGDVRYRRMAMLSLSAFGAAAEKAVPRLTVALEDPDEMTRAIAANSLKLINQPPATAAVVMTADSEGAQ